MAKRRKKVKPMHLFILGVFVVFLLLIATSNRYYLQSSGSQTYKVDRWTGKTWIVTPYGKKEINDVGIQKENTPFPVYNLIVGKLQSSTELSCIKVSGTIANNHSFAATNIMLRVDFSSEKDGAPFHYEVFKPFINFSEQVQPGSTKSFETCMNRNTTTALKDKTWWFTVTPYEADVFE